MSVRPGFLVAGAGIVGALVTLAVLMMPAVRLAYRAPALHIVLETAAALIAVFTAYMLIGRYRRRRLVRDLVMVWGLALLAVANLPLAAIPRSLLDGGDRFATWLLLAVHLMGATAFAAAGVLGQRVVRAPRRALYAAAATAVLLLGAVVAVAVLWPGVLLELEPVRDPPAAASVRAPSTLDPLQVAAHPAVFTAQAVAVVLFAVAAATFTRQAEREHDELLAWVAGAAMLAAVSRVQYAMFPSLYTTWVYPADALRLGSYLLLLVGAGREVSSHWQARAEAAVLEERRRIARDLHDGLAQELAFIVGQSHRLAARRDSPSDVQMVASAAERALHESRRAIAALSQPLDQPIEQLLTEEVQGVAKRHGARVRLDLHPDIEVAPVARETLLRVAREAVGNAARHSGTREITVTLSGGEDVRLTVADDGVGFDPGTAAGRGTTFGLVSMRERVEALGGRVHIHSRPGAGTRVEVSLPAPR